MRYKTCLLIGEENINCMEQLNTILTNHLINLFNIGFNNFCIYLTGSFSLCAALNILKLKINHPEINISFTTSQSDTKNKIKNCSHILFCVTPSNKILNNLINHAKKFHIPLHNCFNDLKSAIINFNNSKEKTPYLIDTPSGIYRIDKKH